MIKVGIIQIWINTFHSKSSKSYIHHWKVQITTLCQKALFKYWHKAYTAKQYITKLTRMVIAQHRNTSFSHPLTCIGGCPGPMKCPCGGVPMGPWGGKPAWRGDDGLWEACDDDDEAPLSNSARVSTAGSWPSPGPANSGLLLFRRLAISSCSISDTVLAWGRAADRDLPALTIDGSWHETKAISPLLGNYVKYIIHNLLRISYMILGKLL